MNSVRRPRRGAIEAHLAGQSSLELSYPDVGATKSGAEGLPAAVRERYTVDHNRERLGEGAEAFARARAALERWTMFELGWAEICWPDAPIQVGTTVGVLARLRGLWSLAACRIVYVTDEETDGVHRFGFGYGTLPDHGVRGEERFTVEWRRDDDSVWYDLLAFSEPASLTARVGRSALRAVQQRFARDSKRAMLRAVGGA